MYLEKTTHSQVGCATSPYAPSTGVRWLLRSKLWLDYFQDHRKTTEEAPKHGRYRSKCSNIIAAGRWGMGK
jgi:hypothetical protein